MTSKTYEAYEHIFTNNNGDTVVIKAPEGQTLVFEGNASNLTAGSDNQIIYNNEDVLVGSSDMTHISPYTFITNLNAPNIIGVVDKNTEGDNATSIGARSDGDTDTGLYGNAVASAVDGLNTYTFLQSPDNGGGGGGVMCYRDITNIAKLVYQTLPTNTGQDIQMCCNEDASKLYFTDDSNGGGVSDKSRYSYYTRSGDFFTFQNGLLGYRVSCTQDFVAVSKKENNYFVVRDTTSTTQTLYDGTGGTPILLHDMKGGDTLVLINGSDVEVWKYSGSWSKVQTLAIAYTPTSISIAGDTMVIGTSTGFFVYEDKTGTYLFKTTITLSGIRTVKTNGNGIYATTGTDITAYIRYDNRWQTITTTTAVALGNIQSSFLNGNLLTLGQPTANTYGQSINYTVSDEYLNVNNSILIGNTINSDIDIITNGFVNISRGLRSNNSFGRVSGNSSQTINRITNVVLTSYWNGVPELSGDAEFSPFFSNGTFTINLSGRYLVQARCYFSANSNGSRRLYLNGSALGNDDIAQDRRPGMSTDLTTLSVSDVIDMEQGDTIYCKVYHTHSSTALTMTNLAKGYFMVYRLG